MYSICKDILLHLILDLNKSDKLKHNNYISFFLSLLIAVGLSLSTIHTHYDTDDYIDGIEYQFSQDTNECAVCASHFKITAGSDLESEAPLFYSDLLFVHTELFIVDPLNNIQDGRAPPFFG